MARARGNRTGPQEPGRIRVTGGAHRGRVLRVPPGQGVRPTADRARQAIFNILESGRLTHVARAPYVKRVVMDLFCGTGVMAIEALSRGAAHAVLIDNDAGNLRTAEENLRSIGLLERATLLRCDATRPLTTPPTPAAAVFLDPPYNEPIGGAALEALARNGWISSPSIAVWETSAANLKPSVPPGFEEIDERVYGASRIMFLRRVVNS